MSNKLTSLTGFGEGDPKPEKSDLGTRIMPGHKRRKTSVTHERDSGGVTVFFKRANYNRGASAKAKALSAKIAKKGPVPKSDWRMGKNVHKKSLDFDYPDARPGSDYMGSR